MIEKREIRIEEGGFRLDAALLSAFPATTRAFVREAIARGDVTVNSARAAKGVKLAHGDVVTVNALAEVSDNVVAPDPQVVLRVVHEDAHIIALDKPPGLAVHPLSRGEKGTLMNGVVARYPECARLGDRPLMAGALHRIDSGTSGLVIASRTQAAFDALRAQFAAQTVEKTYLALVEGCVEDAGRIECDLVHDPVPAYCRMIDPRKSRLSMAERARLKAYHALTAYRPVAHTRAVNEDRTLLEVTIFTGVTHQIRAQLASAGMHIVNDRLYGAFAVEDMTGHALHAYAAKFTHPATGAETRIVAPPPDWAKSIYPA